MNVLVGPNNSGKSTVLAAFRVLAEALNRPRSRNPERIRVSSGTRLGYSIPSESLPISTENVHTDYAQRESRINFRLSNGNSLELHFPSDGGCILIPDTAGRVIRSVGDFKRAFPISIAVVPELGPVEHDEPLLERETVRRGLATHRAARHFRNYWWHFSEGFDEFAELVSRTWPGMEVRRPELADVMTNKLVMFVHEHRIARELYWSGFGFQVWCQLLTHVSHSAPASVVVIDEPEIYLHPEVQRQLLGILRETGPDVILATHSAEIMGEADPSEIALVEKAKRSARRLRDVSSVQAAMDAIGSLQNVTLAQLARTKRIVFVEGQADYRILRRFARKVGLTSLSDGRGLTSAESGGGDAWQRIIGLAWGLQQTVGEGVEIASVLDRDYRCAEEVAAICGELGSHLRLAHIHARKEIENYLLAPAALDRAIAKAVAERQRRGGTVPSSAEPAEVLLERITTPMRLETQAQYIAHRTRYLQHSRRDSAVITAETMSWFESKWRSIESRMELVPGKEVLGKLREALAANLGITLTEFRIIDEFREAEVPADLHDLLVRMDAFRHR